MRSWRTMEGLQCSLSSRLYSYPRSSWRITMTWSCHQSRMSSTRKWTPMLKRKIIIDQEAPHTRAREAKDRSNRLQIRSVKNPWVSKVYPRAWLTRWKIRRTVLLNSLILSRDSTLIWDPSNRDLKLVNKYLTPPRKNWTRRQTSHLSKNLHPKQTRRVAPISRRRSSLQVTTSWLNTWTVWWTKSEILATKASSKSSGRSRSKNSSLIMFGIPKTEERSKDRWSASWRDSKADYTKCKKGGEGSLNIFTRKRASSMNSNKAFTNPSTKSRRSSRNSVPSNSKTFWGLPPRMWRKKLYLA